MTSEAGAGAAAGAGAGAAAAHVLAPQAGVALELRVRLAEGANIDKVDVFSESDPFCVLRLNKDDATKQVSKVCQDTKEPKWNQVFRLPFGDKKLEETAGLTLNLECRDEDGKDKSKLIGSVDIPVWNVWVSEKHRMVGWHTLKDNKNQDSGKILLELAVGRAGAEIAEKKA